MLNRRRGPFFQRGESCAEKPANGVPRLSQREGLERRELHRPGGMEMDEHGAIIPSDHRVTRHAHVRLQPRRTA